MDIKALIGRLKQAIMLYSAYMENADEHMALISESADALETLRKRLADSEENYEFATHMTNEFKVLAKQRYDAIAAANAEIERLKGERDRAVQQMKDGWIRVTKTCIGETVEQLAAANAEIERLRFALADTEALEIGTGERLAAAQLQIKTLRDGLQIFIDSHEECTDFDGFTAQIVSMDDYHAAQELAESPQDLSALHAYGKRIAGAVKEMCAGVCQDEMDEHHIDSNQWYAARACRDEILALPLGQIDIGEL